MSDIWGLMKKLKNCNGEGCHAKLPNCPDFPDCKVESDRISAYIEAELQAMRGALQEARPTLLHFWQQADKNEKKAIDSMVAKIDTALKGGR